MNARIPLAAAILTGILVVTPLTAQLRPADLNGVWKLSGVQVVRPDSTLMQPGLDGKAIIFDGNFVQLYVQAAAGPQQAGRATSAAAPLTSNDQKAARFDRLFTNAGTFVLSDTVATLRYQYAKDPRLEGTTVRVIVRLRSDTVWQTVTTPWSRDSTKSVRTTYKFVRQK